MNKNSKYNGLKKLSNIAKITTKKVVRRGKGKIEKSKGDNDRILLVVGEILMSSSIDKKLKIADVINRVSNIMGYEVDRRTISEKCNIYFERYPENFTIEKATMKCYDEDGDAYENERITGFYLKNKFEIREKMFLIA